MPHKHLTGRIRSGPGRAGTFRPVIAVFLLLLAVSGLYGKGPRDNTLARVDLCIKEKRFTEALTLLSDYIKANPEKFDKAHIRIKRIERIREEYNATGQELLATLVKDSENQAKILALTNRLFEIDPERSAETAAFLNNTRDLALFATNRRLLEEVLAQGQGLIAQGNYAEALQVYIGGLDIYQREFFTGGYGAALENRTRQGIAALSAGLDPFRSIMTSLLGGMNELAAQAGQPADARNLPAYRTVYNRITGALDRLNALRRDFSGTETAFRDDLARIREAQPSIGDRNFLAFVLRLMEGWPDVPGDGIAGVCDTLWNLAASRTRDLTDAKARSVYDPLAAAAEARNYGDAVSRSEVLAGYAALPADVETRWGRYGSAGEKVSLLNQPVESAEGGNFLAFRARQDVSGYLRTLGGLGSRFYALTERDTLRAWKNGGIGDDLIRVEQTYLAAVRQIRTEAQALAGTIRRESAPYQALETSYPVSGPSAGGGSALKATDYTDKAAALTGDLLAAALARDHAAAGRRYTIANGMMEERISRREEEFRDASALFQGSMIRENFLSRFPGRAAALFARMETAAENDAQALGALLTQYGAEPQDILTGPEVRPLREAALVLQNRLESIRSRGQPLELRARYQSSQAASLRQEGNGFFAQARAALAQGNFDTARDRLMRSGNFYDQSLELEDNDEVWNQRNNAVLALDREIARLENEAVLREVQAILGRISEAYFAGDFEQAGNLLTRAQNTWRRTQVEDNPEIVYWTGLVRSGLRMGRRIPVTAPLYPEMSQLLSAAQKDYEEGSRTIATARDDGLQSLNLARQNIRKVQLVYPLNEQAGLLDLRIEQAADPQAFIAAFEQRVNIAVTGTRRRDLQAYGDLLNLRTINPRYPNWQAVITRAEIDMGFRPPPPEPAALARSAELTASVRGIVASRNMNRMEEARSALAEAIRQDPNNQEAKDLYNDSSRLIIGGAMILDRETERKYQQAIAALNKNNPLGALVLVQEIYAGNAQYRYNNRILTLEQRIRSAL